MGEVIPDSLTRNAVGARSMQRARDSAALVSFDDFVRAVDFDVGRLAVELYRRARQSLLLFHSLIQNQACPL